MPSSAAPLAASLAALAICGKRGRWRAALQLLDEVERLGPAPPSAWLSALLACRKHKRIEEQLSLLERMGPRVTAAACNEVLHACRARGDYESAARVWREWLDGDAAVVAADELSFYHMLHLCAQKSEWERACAWLRRMEAHGVAPGRAHYQAALRAATVDRRWDEATSFVAQIPRAILQEDSGICRLGLSAAAETGSVELAFDLVAMLGEEASMKDYAAVLQACRRQGDVEAVEEAWQRLVALGGEPPDELCYAQIIATMLEASAPAHADGLAARAMARVREAAAALPSERVRVVVNAALGCALGAGRHAEAREALARLYALQGAAEAAVQLKVLEACARAGAWPCVAAEAAEAASRAMLESRRSGAADLRRIRELAAAAAAGEGGADAEARVALEALTALGRVMETALLPAGGGGAQAEVGERVSALKAESRDFSRRYSKSIGIEGEAVPIEALYEDDEILVLTKPIGVPVHPRHRFEAGAMINRVVHHLGGRVPFVVHRLDSPTSGVLMFAKTRFAAASLAEQFRNRRLSKQYLAVLCGTPRSSSFEVDVPIAAHPTTSTLSVVASQQEGDGKEALTRFEVVCESSNYFLCRVQPVTGRMHQIRVHADHIGSPLAGDTQYGAAQQPASALPRLLLHAHTLEIKHPSSRRLVRFSSPLPADFIASMATLGFDSAAVAPLHEALNETSGLVKWLHQD
ncbi:hypothetical protein AB1Y20_023147 [Prymnesium parvum]|uniref:Pseudouridine synthase RsuA/RluA-like domain-containing protein n=1 Tax=Prymnesium parvum TaxID=97485 RepID=A0AB34JD90_PRYPA